MDEQATGLAGFYPSWHSRARCLGMDDTTFFGSSDPGTRPPYTLNDIRAARQVCALCPVAQECLQFAIDNREEYGVWAGSTIRERRAILMRSSGNQHHLQTQVNLYIRSLRELARPMAMSGG